jgi:hypothetical protein
MGVGNKVPENEIPKWAMKMSGFHYKKEADRFAGAMMESGYKAVIKEYFASDLRCYRVFYWPKKKG